MIIEDAELITTVAPSINLLPIPVDIIIGNHCLGKSSRYILVSSFAAAVEFLLWNAEPPNALIALANPRVTTKAPKIAIASNSRGAEVGQKIEMNWDDFGSLPEAEQEAVTISKLFSHSSIFMGPDASVPNALQQAEVLTKNGQSIALLMATHGFEYSPQLGIALPSLLGVDKGKLNLVSANKVSQYDLTQSVVFLSSCNAAAGVSGSRRDFFTGLVSAFASSGASLIASTWWEVDSAFARDFSVGFFDKFKTKSLGGGCWFRH